MKRWTIVLLMLASLTLLAAQCATPPAGGGAAAPAPKAEEKVLKLGASLALTGAVSREGRQLRDGYEFWKDWVNERGGVDIGGEKYKVEIIYYDDKSDAETGAKLTEKLITEDKVDFLLGPFSSGIAISTTSIGEKYKKLTIAPLSNSTKIYSRGYKYVFSVLPPATRYLVRLLDMAVTLEPKPETVAFLIRDDPFGISAAEGAADHARSLGLEVVYEQKYPKDAKDLSSLLTQVKAKNPDILLSSTLFQDAVLITRQAKDLKVCPKILGFSVGPAIPDFVTELGDDAEYIYGSEWWLPTMDWKDPVFGSAREFAKAFKEKFGYTPGYHAASGAAAGRILQDALRIAGTKDVDKVREALLNYNEPIFWGPIGWDETGQNIKGASVPIQIQNGKVVSVWPEEAREAEPLYPMPCWDER